jgi:signal transduction histidine kinase
MVQDSIKPFVVQIREKALLLFLTFNQDSDEISAIDTEDEIYLDRNKIQQVIGNLISNAIKFTPEGGEIKVVVKYLKKTKKITPSYHHLIHSKSYATQESSQSSSERNIEEANLSEPEVPHPVSAKSLSLLDNILDADGYLLIEVVDSGVGISDENQKKLFHEIVQFRPELLQNGGGSGLGMWISKNIIDLHKGDSFLE